MVQHIASCTGGYTIATVYAIWYTHHLLGAHFQIAGAAIGVHFYLQKLGAGAPIDSGKATYPYRATTYIYREHALGCGDYTLCFAVLHSARCRTIAYGKPYRNRRAGQYRTTAIAGHSLVGNTLRHLSYSHMGHKSKDNYPNTIEKPAHKYYFLLQKYTKILTQNIVFLLAILFEFFKY